MIQIVGFRKTLRRRNALCSAFSSALVCGLASAGVALPVFSSGSPTDEGVSRTKAQTTAAPRMAIVAGSRKHQRQCCERIDEASNHAPQFRLTTIEWEVFQTDVLVASRSGTIQWVISRVQGGTPMPWNQPLSTQKIPSASTDELNPKSRLQMPQKTSPVTRK